MSDPQIFMLGILFVVVCGVFALIVRALGDKEPRGESKYSTPANTSPTRREYREAAPQMTSSWTNPSAACSDGVCHPSRHNQSSGCTRSQAEIDAAYIAYFKSQEFQTWAEKFAAQAVVDRSDASFAQWSAEQGAAIAASQVRRDDEAYVADQVARLPAIHAAMEDAGMDAKTFLTAAETRASLSGGKSSNRESNEPLQLSDGNTIDGEWRQVGEHSWRKA